ncbi:MAG: hypothetical protein P8Y12_13055 [Gammaproteobacteria bacterium]
MNGVNQIHNNSTSPVVDPRIAGIGIMTANRPALLERALKSYAQFATANRSEIEYVVFDDSKEIDMCNANRHVADRVRQQYDVPVRFAGWQEKATYVKQLGECLGHSRDILQRSLMRTEGYTLGQNRNALLLDSIGSLYFSADDDTICSVAIAPDAQQSLRLSEGIDPCSYWCYQNTTRNGNDTKLIKKDVLDTHGQLLGRRLSEIISPDLQQSTELAGRLNKPESSVRITLNGLLGDCGWGAPFGLWHQPMGYLASKDAVIGHLPFSLIHEPVPTRRFWPGEITRTAAGIDLCRLMIEAIACCSFHDGEINIEDRLMSLGRHLIRLAAVPGNRLRKHLSQCLQDSNQCFEQTLMKRATRESICNTAYANDVTQYFNKLRTSQSNEDYWLPLDLRSVDGVKGAEARARQSLREFGELLETWPAIIHAAKTLRNADIRLSVPR